MLSINIFLNGAFALFVLIEKHIRIVLIKSRF